MSGHRRSFLQRLSALPVIGGMLPAAVASAAPARRDYFKEIGVGTFINAAGTYTTLTASLMRPEVVDAIEKVRTGRNGFHDDVPLEAVTILKATEIA